MYIRILLTSALLAGGLLLSGLSHAHEPRYPGYAQPGYGHGYRHTGYNLEPRQPNSGWGQQRPVPWVQQNDWHHDRGHHYGHQQPHRHDHYRGHSYQRQHYRW